MTVTASVLPTDPIASSYLILLAFLVLGAAAGLLYWIGLVGWVLRLVGLVVQAGVQSGFWLWEQLFTWADWRALTILIAALLGLGWAVGQGFPPLALLCGTALLFLGTTTCLAYVSIDWERYEVARGYKALYKPLKGQELAVNLVRYGPRVGAPLLIAAVAGAILGFALTNQGLYGTIGKNWYTLEGEASPGFADFLAYTLINLLRIADLVDLANTYNFAHVTYVRQAKWPAATLLAVFKTFFTLVLLEQIFASVRRLRLLAETVNDFWSPHVPIHERASSSLPQHGPGAVWPLLESLRSIEVVTAEQRLHIPRIIADIGPGAIPILVEHLNDPSENVRAVAAAALGHLHALDTVPALVRLGHDPSTWVRQSLVEALGTIQGTATPDVKRRGLFLGPPRTRVRWLWRMLRWRRAALQTRAVDPVGLAVTTLRAALADPTAAVRMQAARSLGLLGTSAKMAASDLIGALHDADEAVQCQAAEALGKVGGPSTETVDALVKLLAAPSPPLRTAAAKALGELKKEAESAVPALLPLLQEREESIRQAAAEAIGQIGTVREETIPALTGGLTSSDNLVQAQTAEVLGDIGAAAAEAAPALAEVLKNGGNDRVRAKAAEALGKMGEAASEAVPQLVRALRGKDSWVSALAAEALGEIGDASAGAVPALIRSLRHRNPQVRANAAEALGKLGDAAASALSALEQAAQDDDDEVRSHVFFALGEIGPLTDTAEQLLFVALDDAHPEVRAAAVEAMGKRAELKEAGRDALLRALEDANDQVRIEATKALPRLAEAAPPVIDGLCRLLQDDNATVQVHAALALGKFGPAAAAAGADLLRAAQAGEADVREQALRALALIQPPEALQAFSGGLKDAQPEIRKIASAGLVKAADIPPEAVPGLVEALRDPETQIRANAAAVMARLDPLPAAAVPLLIDCAADRDEGLRLSAALALRTAAGRAVREVFQHLLTDTNPRLQLLAAGFLLETDAADAEARAVVAHALADPLFRFRKAALELIDALGQAGTVFTEELKQRALVEVEPELSDLLTQLLDRLEQPSTTRQPTDVPRENAE